MSEHLPSAPTGAALHSRALRLALIERLAGVRSQLAPSDGTPFPVFHDEHRSHEHLLQPAS